MKYLFFLLTLVTCFIRNNDGFGMSFQQQQQQSSFTSLIGKCNKSHSSRPRISSFATMTPEEERAAALSEYLAKAHEEKLRVIKEVEQKKNQEIDQLKQQIQEMKSSTSSSSAVVMVNGCDSIAVKALDDMNKEELMAKIFQYQNFMRQYMIDAQEQKYRAVLDAQIDAQKKLSESLSLLGLLPAASTSDRSVLSLSSSSSVAETPLYAARNVAVAKAAAAGKSRWGPMEVERVATSNSNNYKVATTTMVNGASLAAAVATTTMQVNGASAPALTTVTSSATSPVVVPVPPEVAEADHGLRSDGSVGGLSLAERVYFGSTASAAEPTTTASITSTVSTNPMEVLYHKRNIKIVQAAQAGTSNRWGAQEVDRVSNIVSATSGQFLPLTPTTTQYVSTQRVNFGASILGQQ